MGIQEHVGYAAIATPARAECKRIRDNYYVRTGGLAMLGGMCALLTLGCTTGAEYRFIDTEEQTDRLYDDTPIVVSGRVIDERGAPVGDAAISLIAWGDNAANTGKTTHTAADGTFTLPELARRAALVRIARPGFYTELVPVDLQQPLAQTTVELDPVRLYETRDGRARLIFGGDVMMGRRFLDHDGEGVWGGSNDLLRQRTLASDSKALFRFVHDLMASDDHTSVNLETTVTRDPRTPHPRKNVTFYTLPPSVRVLPSVGIESVSLGNNHVYDYLEAGMTDTLVAVAAAELGWFGAGTSETDARANRHHQTIHGVPLALQGFSSLKSASYGSPELELTAADMPIVKGGALFFSGSNAAQFLGEETPSRCAIPVIHDGAEYTYQHDSRVRERLRNLVELGATLVVAHHPHLAHGVSVVDGADDGDRPRFVLPSLGNLVFDQAIYETLRSYLAMVDIELTPAGCQVARLQLIPYRLDGYVPRLLAGQGLERMGRHIGHLSTLESAPADGITGAVVFTEGGRLHAFATSEQYTTSTRLDPRSVPLAQGATGLLAFQPDGASDFLAGVQADIPATCEVGRDLLVLGDFEEQDVDDGFDEGDLWDQTSSHFVQNTEVYSGRSAMVLLRKHLYSELTSLWLQQSIAVASASSLTLTGVIKGQNAGELTIAVRWMHGREAQEEVIRYTHPAGTYEWTRFAVDLTVPDQVDGLRFYLRHAPMESDQGAVFVDDLALIEWSPQVLEAQEGASVATPNDYGYLRCQAAGPADRIALTLEHRAYRSR